jgi:hypothetical protein
MFTAHAQDLVRAETSKDVSLTDRIWDAAAWTALMSLMWQRPGMPPARVEISDLTLEQLEVVRSLVKSQPFARD